MSIAIAIRQVNAVLTELRRGHSKMDIVEIDILTIQRFLDASGFSSSGGWQL